MDKRRALVGAAVLVLALMLAGTAWAKFWKTSTIVVKASPQYIAKRHLLKYNRGRMGRFTLYIYRGYNARGRLVGRRTGTHYVKFRVKTGQVYYFQIKKRLRCGTISGGISVRIKHWHTQTVVVPVVNSTCR